MSKWRSCALTLAGYLAFSSSAVASAEPSAADDAEVRAEHPETDIPSATSAQQRECFEGLREDVTLDVIAHCPRRFDPRLFLEAEKTPAF